MCDELEVFGNEDGLAIFGDAKAMEQFLRSEGLASQEFGLDRVFSKLGAGATSAHLAASAAANSGRWVQLTEKSAKALKANKLMKGSSEGLSRTILMKDGKITGILEITKNPLQILSNPAALTSVAGIMSQMASQQTLDDIADYLAKIDEKVDDILRAQKDTVFSEMIGIGVIVDEAILTRNAVGKVSEVTWSKVQAAPQKIASTQVYALRQLDALAATIEDKTKISDVAKSVSKVEPAVREWIAVLARCFQLQEALSVLEIERVLDAAPEDLDSHRRGLRAAKEKRCAEIVSSTQKLLDRMNAAAGLANSKVLLHPTIARSVVHTSNRVELDINNFHSRLGIEGGAKTVEAKTWVEAAVELRSKVVETGVESFEASRRFGGDALDVAKNASAKVVEAGNGGLDATKRLGTETRDLARHTSDKVAIGLAERLLRGRSGTATGIPAESSDEVAE